MTDAPQHSNTLARVPTGIPGLDKVLLGGLFQSSMYIVRGTPGAGKTILSNQFAFHHAQAGGKVVYISLLAESNTRMFAYLRSLDFFDDVPIGFDIVYLSASHVLETLDLRELQEMMRHAMQDLHASLIILDGLSALSFIATGPLELKKFIRNLQAYVDLARCTVLLLQDEGEQLQALDTTVDGVLYLNNTTTAVGNVRYLYVSKLRGSGFLRGRHLFEITEMGLTVYPRTEALLRHTLPPDVQHVGQAMFGVLGLDEMLGGGLPSGSTTVLLGTAGSGRTMLGLQFLAGGVAQGEPGLYFGFDERPSEVFAKSGSIGLLLKAAEARGLFVVQWQPMYENLLDMLVAQLLATVSSHNIRRVFVDNLEGFQRALDSDDRLTAVLAALATELRGRGVTTLFSLELAEIMGVTIAFPVPGISMIADNILLLRYVLHKTVLQRMLSIVKMRRGAYNQGTMQLIIDTHGINVAALP